jgi:hypothetical protein
MLLGWFDHLLFNYSFFYCFASSVFAILTLREPARGTAQSMLFLYLADHLPPLGFDRILVDVLWVLLGVL